MEEEGGWEAQSMVAHPSCNLQTSQFSYRADILFPFLYSYESFLNVFQTLRVHSCYLLPLKSHILKGLPWTLRDRHCNWHSEPRTVQRDVVSGMAMVLREALVLQGFCLRSAAFLLWLLEGLSTTPYPDHRWASSLAFASWFWLEPGPLRQALAYRKKSLLGLGKA